MRTLLNFPSLVFLTSLLLLWVAGSAGRAMRKRHSRDAAEQEDLSTIVAATLTLLGLIIGFSFSMAISRYDQRKTYEEAEANAIGTEYARADLLPPADAARVRALLKSYLEQRIQFYKTREVDHLRQINDTTTQLQADLWAAVRGPATAQPTPVSALVLSGMNDVLNSQGYTQAGWWNRIPTPAWILLAAMGACSNFLIGYSRRSNSDGHLYLVLPLLVSVSFFIIADIDSPRGGVIRVRPQNLEAIAPSLQGQ